MLRRRSAQALPGAATVDAALQLSPLLLSRQMHLMQCCRGASVPMLRENKPRTKYYQSSTSDLGQISISSLWLSLGHSGIRESGNATPTARLHNIATFLVETGNTRKGQRRKKDFKEIVWLFSQDNSDSIFPTPNLFQRFLHPSTLLPTRTFHVSKEVSSIFFCNRVSTNTQSGRLREC